MSSKARRSSTTSCIQAQAPTFKWGISIANLADMQRPAENVSYPQQLAVTATGIIWSRFATQVRRLNWPCAGSTKKHRSRLCIRTVKSNGCIDDTVALAVADHASQLQPFGGQCRHGGNRPHTAYVSIHSPLAVNLLYFL